MQLAGNCDGEQYAGRIGSELPAGWLACWLAGWLANWQLSRLIVRFGVGSAADCLNDLQAQW